MSCYGEDRVQDFICLRLARRSIHMLWELPFYSIARATGWAKRAGAKDFPRAIRTALSFRVFHLLFSFLCRFP
jgi:hypothetical protein